MCQRNLMLTIVLIGLSFWVFACAHVNYVGKSFEPTTDVAVYFSKEEIEHHPVVEVSWCGATAIAERSISDGK